ncbi:hypothetical protein R3W88_003566 [Solanum pinnatisectum]|uniref:Reverse transcriptase domain-containing protein n=1 Tax=Solanum pinnatisectum TaxID=50273 RepID=A0AAV9MPD9_9SOLN|nr:hypothetical protein R3W88_003566 [Solanum pinnatisectum]
MEYLSRLLKQLGQQPQFNYHLKCARLNLIQLGFADDLLLFCRGDAISIQMLFEQFQCFSKASGLIANLTKSSIYCGGVSTTVQDELVELLGFNKGLSYGQGALNSQRKLC